ncbi:hypothetical protein [Caldimonas tepidiphila]|uniref:hypothetical protein n=1 Tax=Caldimonas tepidiphila TaxID=2315841 RepID=UPI000E5C0D6B|nr:hypothetical protein [Caldimonas tepidiphila]
MNRPAARRKDSAGTLVLDGVLGGALLAGYLLLFALHGPPWPPAGHERLPPGGSIVGAALALVSLALGTMTLRALQADWRTATAAGIAALLLLQAASARVLWLLFDETHATRDPYGALLWAIALYLLAHLAACVLMLLRAAVALLAGRLHPQRPRVLENAVLLSHFTAVLLLASLALLALFPLLVAGHGT